MKIIKNIKFRKIRSFELSKVYTLYCKHEKIPICKKELKKAKKFYKSKILKNGSFSFGAFLDGDLIGVINIYKNWLYYPYSMEKPFVQLECLVVHKDFRKMGIATLLIKQTVELIKKEGACYIISQSSSPFVEKILNGAGLIVTEYKDHRILMF